jgi:hypothetical protein
LGCIQSRDSANRLEKTTKELISLVVSSLYTGRVD